MLFEPALPDGFLYRVAFITPAEEQAVAASIAEVAFDTFVMRGVAARRRVKFYGAGYEEFPAAPMPDFLTPLKTRLAEWAGVAPDAFVMALINEYRPGATIGWHRDAPKFGITAGVSLLSSCRMRLRPYVAPQDLVSQRGRRKTTHEITLEPQSAYLITGIARSGYEHSIPAAESLRYSVTFRTLRR